MSDPATFVQTLNEYTGLFAVLAEEDPGYRQIELLQDAGIIPVHGMGDGNPTMG